MKKLLLMMTAASLSVQAASLSNEREVFLAGISNALKVVKYQSKKALGKDAYEGKYCLLFQPESGTRSIDDFTVTRLEALSLAQKEEPLFYVSGRKKYFCFTTAESKEAIDAKKKYLGEKFSRTFLTYTPKVIKIKKGVPIVPSIGILFKDQTPTIDTLSDKITELEAEKAEMRAKMSRMTTIVEKAVSDLRSISNTTKHTTKPYATDDTSSASAPKASSEEKIDIDDLVSSTTDATAAHTTSHTQKPASSNSASTDTDTTNTDRTDKKKGRKKEPKPKGKVI